MSDNQKRSPQGKFWQGKFGDEYSKRSGITRARVVQRIWMWTRILRNVEHCLPTSCVEIGPNLGLNLHALDQVLNANLFAVEPNEFARRGLAESGILPQNHIFEGFGDSIPLEDGAVELSISSGVMIHIAPENLLGTYRELYRVTSRFIVTIEYFSDQPEAIEYRGYIDRLFKRDFGMYWHENFPDLELVDYGFLWKGTGAGDNSNWWLHRKN